MKNYFSKSILLKLTLILTVLGFSVSMILRSSGSPGGYTGSPADGKDCKSCHTGGTDSAITGFLTSNVPVAGYTHGNTYTITVSVPGAIDVKKGFEVSPQNASGDLLGTIVAGTGQKLVNTGKAVTHSSVLLSSPAVWTFQWTAPAAGTGNVTFYGSYISGYVNVYTSNLTIKENTVSISDERITNFNLFSNPVKDKIQFSFFLRKPANVTISIESLDGKRIAKIQSGRMNAGDQKINYSLDRKIKHGVYLLNLDVDGKSTVKKMMID